MTLLQALIQLKTDGPSDPKMGICSNVYKIAPFMPLRALGDLFERLGHDREFPVADPDEYDNEVAYTLSDYKWVGAYGDARMALLDECIAKLKAEAVERIDAAMGLK